MEKREINQIEVIVIAGIILAIITGIGAQVVIAWRTQNRLLVAQELLTSRFDNIAELRKQDALRTQGNLHDIAAVIDNLSDALWEHMYPHTVRQFTPLSNRILDVPASEKALLNHHIGDVPLVSPGASK